MIIFLGAGASNAFGVPTMKEFVREFEKELKENNSNKEMPLYQDIRTILERRDGANIDLEVVLTVLNDLKDNPLDPTAHYLSSKLEECIKLSENDEPFIDFKIVSELKEDLIRYIKEKCSCDAKERKKVIKVYDELFKLLWGDVDIFTTNYDAYLEDVYFKSKGIPFVDGFSEGKWNPNVFKDKQRRLFKLHGSITWYLTEKDDLIKRDVVQGEKLSDGTEIKEHMLYPMRNKKRYEDPFSELYGRLRTGLQTTKFCMVIGYSFGDESIRNIFGRAMKERPFMINPREITIYDNFEDSEKYEGYAFRIKEFFCTTEMDKDDDIMSDDPHGAVKIEYRNPRGDIDSIMLEKDGFETIENEANNSTIILTRMTYFDCSTFPILAGDELIGEYEEKECISINMGKKDPKGLAVVLIDPCVDEIIDKHFKNLRMCIIPYALKFEKLSEIRSSEINKLTTSKK